VQSESSLQSPWHFSRGKGEVGLIVVSGDLPSPTGALGDNGPAERVGATGPIGTLAGAFTVVGPARAGELGTDSAGGCTTVDGAANSGALGAKTAGVRGAIGTVGRSGPSLGS
jgi:hypothetical protein